MTTTTMSAHQFSVGSKVHLRALRFGEPGTVIRFERGKAVVFGADMDYWSRHTPASLCWCTSERGSMPSQRST